MTDLTTYQGRYLVAVSGGPDSMALFDMLAKTGSCLEAAHVNYHKRESAYRDEKLVREYCQKKQIPFHKLDLYPEQVEGNFQAYARKARYAFFARLCKERDLEAVMVAHHKDDLIETYLMQKDKKLGVQHFGLAQETVIQGVRVIRPLLETDKKELLAYCRQNQLPYGIDETNLEDDYTRNRIRHQVVEQMSVSEKEDLVREIETRNQALRQKQKIIQEDMRDHYDAEEFFALPYLIDRLRMIFPDHSGRYYEEISRQLKETDRCIFRNEEVMLVKEYGMIDIFKIPQDYEYIYHGIEAVQEGDYGHFRISREGKSTEALTVHPEDFPIMIRNPREGDQIRMRYGTKKINRFFIDRKIPLKDRLTWPVVINCRKEVILLPGLGCDINHYSQNPDLYVIEL